MSRRAKNTETPISLFSFQDIITLVSGIMMLITLFLVLDIVSRRPEAQSANNPDNKTNQDIEQIKAQISTKSKIIAGQRELLDKLKGASSQELKNALEEKKGKQADLIVILDDLQKKLDAITAEKKAEVTLIAKLKDLEKMGGGNQNSFKGIKEKVFVYEGEPGEKMPILIECSKEGIKAKLLQDNAPANSFFDPDDISSDSSVKQFADWLKTRDNSKESCYILVKPSAVGYFRDLRKIVTDNNFDLGYEPISEDTNVVFDKSKEGK